MHGIDLNFALQVTVREEIREIDPRSVLRVRGLMPLATMGRDVRQDGLGSPSQGSNGL